MVVVLVVMMMGVALLLRSRGAFCGMALGGPREAPGARVRGASRNGDDLFRLFW